MAKRIKSGEEIFGKRVSDMTEAERLSAIERLEAMRDEVMYQLEDLMAEISAESGSKKHSKRRYKLGDSPNDN